jgi:tRNA splicing ligase
VWITQGYFTRTLQASEPAVSKLAINNTHKNKKAVHSASITLVHLTLQKLTEEFSALGTRWLYQAHLVSLQVVYCTSQQVASKVEQISTLLTDI